MTREKLAGVLPRAALDTGAAVERIRPVCEDVRDRGAAAVREYTARFDGVDLATTALRVSRREIAEGAAAAPAETVAALRLAAERIAEVSSRLIVNRPALKTQPEEVGGWIERLRTAVDMSRR